MKRLFTIFATFAMLCAVGCEEQGSDDVTPNDKPGTEEPEDPKPENIFFGLDRESVSISPDGGSVDVVVYSNYKWDISGTSDWCTPSATSGEANEDGQKVTFSADVAYDTREAIFWFRCADEKIKFVVSQNLKEVIIADEHNTFNVSSEGGIVTIAYQTSIECEVIIPDKAKEWITFANADATRGLVAENINLNIAENTTYSARSAVVKVVKVGDNTLFAEYTINQVQNDAIIAKDNTINLGGWAQSINIAYKTNVECEVIIPEEAKSWISLAPATRALVNESATLTIAENTTYSARSAVIKVVAVDNEDLVVEYTINQVQNDAIIAEDNTFKLKGWAQSINITYKTNVECEVIIPEEAQSWISLAPATRALVNESATLNIADNNTGAERSAVVKVVATNNNELVAEYTITQNQRYYIEYTSTNGSTIASYDRYAFGATILRNEYIDGKGYIEFNAPITSIGDWAFCECTSLISITIPDSVTSIGDWAFAGCSSLTSVTIGNGVTSIGTSTFSDCTSLTSVNIGNGVTSIGDWAFYGCSSLTSITIPDSVTWIGELPFAGCSSLTSVTIGNGVTSIGEWTFSDCTSLTSVNIGNGVTSIGDYAFLGCSSLTSITIPDSVTTIGGTAFFDCTSLTDTYVNITDLAAYAIGNTTSQFPGAKHLMIDDTEITELVIPDSVTSIGSSAFEDCTSLTSVTIGNGVTSIGGSAFYGCTSLTSITIPDSVTSIGEFAFAHCDLQTSVTIPDSVTSIGGSAFAGCTSLISVTIPDSVTSIGHVAFGGCSSLTSFYGKYASEDGRCLIIDGTLNSFAPAGLTEYTIPDSVTSIGGWAFYGCTSLTSVTIGGGVTSIGDDAFRDCTSLTSVYCKATTPPRGGSSMFVYLIGDWWYTNIGCTIYVPTESVDAYKAAYGWSAYADDIVGYDFK